MEPGETSHNEHRVEPLEGFVGKRRRSLKSVKRNDRGARVLRVGAPLLGALIAAAFLATLREPAIEASPARDMFGLAAGEDLMTKPRFVGRDASGRMVHIEAQRALRREASGRLELDNPTATRSAPGDTAYRSASAKRGYYRETDKQLELEGNVTLDLGDGHVFHTRRALVDLEGGHIDGPVAVHGSGPMGTISADTFDMTHEDQRLVFSGNVRLSVDAAAADEITGGS